MNRPHASRVVIRFPAYYLTVALMLASAAVTLAVLWWAFALLFSAGAYVQSAP